MVERGSRIRGFIRKWLEILGGFGLLIVGAVMVPLPGPGWAVIAAGLFLLGRHFAWARRANAWVMRRMVQAKNLVMRRRRPTTADDPSSAVESPPPVGSSVSPGTHPQE